VSRSGRQGPTPAAGAVLWRPFESSVQVALVHRPRYDDWTLPKGKLENREQPLWAAIREVKEETGADVQLGRRLTSVQYLVNDAPKRVSYWSMRYRSGAHQPSDEVDTIQWLTIAEATRQLSYSIDRGVLADFARLPAQVSTVLLMRHAKAGKRSDYRGEDTQRPLDKLGRRLARDSVACLQAFGPEAVTAADRVRCEQTVRPLADRLGLAVSSGPEFSDEAYLADPKPAVLSLIAQAERHRVSVICSQGKAIPGLLADLAIPRSPGSPRSASSDKPSRKGSVWALSVHRGSVVAADYYPHPDA
jgi:8-oxo-dGTP pyrophosphatase MutT (NUDIX family)/phosphohistidine phosphatase SixA